MTVQALRNRIGNADLLTVFKKWNKKNAYDNGSIKKFRKLSEQVSGEDLKGFFKHWLYDTVKPAATAENGLEDVSGITAADVAGLGRADRQDGPDRRVRAQPRLTHGTPRSGPAPDRERGRTCAAGRVVRDHRRRATESGKFLGRHDRTRRVAAVIGGCEGHRSGAGPAAVGADAPG